MELEEDMLVLNNVTKFHKVFDLESRHRFKW